MIDTTKRRRVFFALWPDDEVASHLAALAQHLVTTPGARATPPQNLHLTLLFVGAVTTAQIDQLMAIANDVRAEFCAALDLASGETPGAVRLDRLGFWPQGGILWAGSRAARVLSPSRHPLRRGECFLLDRLVAQLFHQRRLFTSVPATLAAMLTPRLRAAGFHIEPRPFAPHVTLARRVRCASLPRLESPLTWPVREFALLESIAQPLHPRYETLAVFPLEPEESGA
jgi:2'-5' RNA ligase